ncbi:hypothetical protein DER44DRAFT_795641 [Fusarium oxysporum]|nr:hypothetical protein DER44DRAFT_795641 [Fusarium oxysporum]
MNFNKYDWSGITDAAERKKRQSRLRQRAWRDRKRAIDRLNAAADWKSQKWEGYGMLVSLKPDQSSHPSSSSNHPQRVEVMSPRHHDLPSLDTGGLIPPLLPYSTLNAPGESPHPIVFPLSADHCLITLVQYNVVQAIIQNMSILSTLHRLPPGCQNAFGVSKINFVAQHRIPEDLQPTHIQRVISAPFWINAIPFPGLRDNLILMADRYNPRELLLDLGLRVYEGFDDTERCGFLVWDSPWSGHGWEVSEGFVRKWGFLLKGCETVLESTNRWRQMRGEDKLPSRTT